MSAALDTVLRHLNERDIPFDTSDGNDEVRFTIKGMSSDYTVYAEIDEPLLKVFTYPGIYVPAGARPQVAEVLCRVNWWLKAGEFEMDIDDGRVRFYAYALLADNDLSDEAIEYVLARAFGLLDEYVPAILSCIYGNIEPAEAVRDILPSKRARSQAGGAGPASRAFAHRSMGAHREVATVGPMRQPLPITANEDGATSLPPAAHEAGLVLDCPRSERRRAVCLSRFTIHGGPPA